MNKNKYKKQIENNSLIFLSTNNMNGSILNPRIPKNYFTQNGYEDNKTSRVCFAPDIDKALMALSQRCNGMELYVHSPENIKKLKLKTPTIKQVPDSQITGEVWSLNPTKVKCIGKIKVIDDKGNDGLKFKYGENESELYEWNYNWLNNTKL